MAKAPEVFNPWLYRSGPQRRLSSAEMSRIGRPCPTLCGGTLKSAQTRFSEYVHCPTCDRVITPNEAMGGAWLKHSFPTAKSLSTGPVGDREKRLTALGEALKGEKVVEGPVVSAATETKKRVAAAGEEYAKKASSLSPKERFESTLYQRIAKLASKIQDSYRQGSLSAGFGLRREVMFARLWHAAVKRGLEDQVAAYYAYRLVAQERAPEEERGLYEEAWAAEFGRQRELPDIKLPDDYTKPRDVVLHQQAGQAIVALEAGVPLWLTSEAGEGKTVLTKQLAGLLGLNYVRLQGTLDRTVDDIIGGWGYVHGKGTVWRDGVISACARTPTLLHIDEVTSLAHEVQFEMHALLEGEPVMQAKNGGVTIDLHPQFRVVANDNSVGQGEAVAYVGTRSTNLAFRDRWAFLRIDPLMSAARKRIVLGAIK